MGNRLKKAAALLAGYFLILAGWTPLVKAQQGPSVQSYVAGVRVATNYGYGYNNVNGANIVQGFTGTGAQSMTVCPALRALPDGRVIPLFNVNAYIGVDIGTAIAETVLPTAVSLIQPPIGQQGDQQCAVITATFANAHGQSQFTNQVRSGTFGLQEAINDAAAEGGTVAVDNSWAGTNATFALTTPYSSVTIADYRYNAPQYWNAVPSVPSTYIAVPTVLSASTAVPSATPVGAFGTGTYFMCIAYVDIAGQEGACSTTFSQAGLATGSFIFSPPAASTGAVGYTIYISLTGGTYSLAYQVPLTASVCRLTTIETITPACAVTNALYSQTGATATVTAITVNTSPVDMQLGGVSGTLLTGNPNGRTAYNYAPSSHIGAFGVPTIAMPFTIGGIGSATPIAIGTVNLPQNVFNYVGRRWRVCGRYINTDVNSTVQNINIYWDAPLSNIAGSPVKIGALAATPGPGTAAAYSGDFCEEFTTTIAGAGATSSVQPGFNFFDYFLTATPAAIMVGGDTNTAAVGLLNMAGSAGFSTRLSVVHTNTTGNATPQLQSLTIEIL